MLVVSLVVSVGSGVTDTDGAVDIDVEAEDVVEVEVVVEEVGGVVVEVVVDDVGVVDVVVVGAGMTSLYFTIKPCFCTDKVERNITFTKF